LTVNLHARDDFDKGDIGHVIGHRVSWPIARVSTDPMIDWRACTYAVLRRKVALVIEAFRGLDKAEEWLTARAKATEKRGE
jgi:hypothetical protein